MYKRNQRSKFGNSESGMLLKPNGQISIAACATDKSNQDLALAKMRIILKTNKKATMENITRFGRD